MSVERSARRSGFTLVEILTVLAIIAVLSAILFPVFARVREKGRQATCTNNLKQIALAMQQYVQDHDGSYPASGISKEEQKGLQGWVWVYRMRDYLKDPQVKACPSYGGARTAPLVAQGTDYLYNFQRLSDYSTLRQGVDGSHWKAGQHEAVLLHPTATWLNTDLNAAEIDQSDAQNPGDSYTGSCGRVFGWEIRHSGGANYSFVDGHVKWLLPTQMSEVECPNEPLRPRIDRKGL